MIRVIKRIILGLTVAYISLLPNFYLIFDAQNRFNLIWNHEYHAAILTAIAILALVYLVAYAILLFVVRRFPRLRFPIEVLGYTLLWAIAVRTVVSILYRSGLLDAVPWCYLATRVAKLLYYGVIPVSFIACFLPLAEKAIRRFYALLAPAVLFLMIWPVTYTTYQLEDLPLPPILDQQRTPGAVPASQNVYIFLFDEWSYERGFPRNRPWDEMTNLCTMLQTATLYENAYSPGSRTGTSIPRFLYQDNKSFQGLRYDDVRELVLSKMPVSGSNIFTDAKSFFRVVIGFWLDYPGMLGDSVDFATRIHNESAWRSYGTEVEWLLRSQLNWLRVVHESPFQEKDPPSVVWIYSLKRVHRMALKTIQDVDRPTMAFFHYCLPHYPFVWDRYGLKNPLPEDVDEPTVPNYMDNLRRLDTIISEIVTALKRSGKWDSSLIIMTADHSWRRDPDVPGYDAAREDAIPQSRWKHVPLIIKHPHQKTAELVTEPMFTAEIYPVIREVLQSVARTNSVEQASP